MELDGLDEASVMSYIRRITAFIDILGFKHLVDQSVYDSSVQEQIFSALDRILDNKKLKDRTRLDKIDGVQVSTFSDCAVISYPTGKGHESSFFDILMDLVYIQLDLAHRGILIRGGVTIGELFHGDNIVFGPALNKATGLEAEVAVYPRIIMTEDTFQEGVRLSQEPLYGPYDNTNDVNQQILEKLVRRDSDGLLFINMLRQDDEMNDYGNEYYFWLNDVRNIILKGLAESTDEKITVKYRWLKNYFNSVVTDDSIPFPVPEECLLDGTADDFIQKYRELEIME